METNLATELLKGTPLQAADAARLVLETLELLGDAARPHGHDALMSRLRSALQLGARALQQKELTVPFHEAAWTSVAARSHRRPATKRDLRHFTRRLLRVPGAASLPLRSMSAQDCRRILHAAFPASVHSFRKGRAILHSVFAFGRRRGWCDGNPVDCVEVPPVQEREITPLKPVEVRRLESAACQPRHRPMRFSLYLMAYCGLRPAEVGRLRPADIRWAERVVVVRPCVSKTGGGRVVPLRRCGSLGRAEAAVPRNWLKRWRELRREAGFADWRPDVLRHTFATYHAARFRNLAELQFEMGHASLDLLRTRYLNAGCMSARAAKEFWKE